MTDRFFPRRGARTISNNMSLPEVWAELHSNADMWGRAGFSAEMELQRQQLDKDCRILLSRLVEVSRLRWFTLAEAAGLTPYSTIALSWTRGATLDDVAALWLETTGPLDPSPECLRPAQMIYPAFYPRRPVMTEILAAAGGRPCPALGLLMLSVREPITYNLGPEIMASARGVVGFAFAQRPPANEEARPLWSSLRDRWMDLKDDPV